MSDLVGFVEMAELLELPLGDVMAWIEDTEEFPPPVAVLSIGPVWSWEAVVAWLRDAPGWLYPTKSEVDDLDIETYLIDQPGWVSHGFRHTHIGPEHAWLWLFRSPSTGAALGSLLAAAGSSVHEVERHYLERSPRGEEEPDGRTVNPALTFALGAARTWRHVLGADKPDDVHLLLGLAERWGGDIVSHELRRRGVTQRQVWGAAADVLAATGSGGSG
jgi:hypothetical protein